MPDRSPTSNSTTPDGSAKPGWRGKRGNLVKTIRHRWQRDWTALATRRVRTRDHRRRLRLGLLLLLFVCLVAFFVFNLLYTPAQVPLVAVVGTSYDWPFPPNAWAQEDLDGLMLLDGETLDVADVSAAWSSQERGLHALDRQLRDVARAGSRSGQVIVYVSMHGLVDGNGIPCLAPPGSSPLKAQTWLPVSELLARIKAQNLPDAWRKLVILDCTREQVNWNLGLIYNSFADGLAKAVADAQIPNLAVLNSTSPGQRAWVSPELKCSVFGNFLRRGLGGEADETIEGGNGDRQITLRELHAYLQKEVDGWTQANRSAAQQPLLLPADVKDFELTWAPHRRWRNRHTNLVPAAAEESLAVPENDVAKLWHKHEGLQAFAPLRFDPLAWRDFEHKLLWFEQLRRAGGGYATLARDVYGELKTAIAKMEERAEAAGSGNVLAQAEIFARRAPQTIDIPPLHSLPLAERFGQIEASRASALRAALDEFVQEPTPVTLNQAMVQYSNRRDAPPLAELNFPRLLERNMPIGIWRQPAAVRSAVTLHNRAETSCVPYDERVQYVTRDTLNAGDRERRSSEDRLFVATEESLAESNVHAAQAQSSYGQADSLAGEAGEALNLNDRAAADTPYLAEWLTRPAISGEWPVVAEADSEVQHTLLPLIESRRVLATALGADHTSPDQPSGALPWRDVQKEVAEKHKRLRDIYLHQVNRLLKLEKPTGAAVREIEAALALPLLPAAKRDALARLYDDFSNKLATTPADPDAKPAPLVPSATDYADRVASRWTLNPAVAILERKGEPLASEPAAPATHLHPRALTARMGQEVRQLLATLPAKLQSLRDFQPEPSADPAAVVDHRANRSLAAELARAAGSFWFAAPESDPIRRLRHYDLSQLLVWYADRSLTDFWGPGGEHEPALFDVSTADCLLAAHALGEAGPAMQHHIDQLTEILEQRRVAARNALSTAASDIVLVSEAEAVPLDVAVRPGPASSLKALPPGSAAVLVRDTLGRINGTSTELPLTDMPDKATEFHYKLPGDALTDRGPILQAIALYRGHPFSTSFLLRSAGGTVVDYSPYRYGPAKVTLNGRSRRRASIVFILDCSHSMNQLTDVEGPAGEEKAPRLDVAKSALASMLTRLAAQGDSRVGVRFYGHRVGWNTAKPDQMLRQNDYARTIPETLVPSEDVELVLPLGRFDDVIAGGVLQLLPSLKPWGETPLYLAIIQALGDFAKDDPDTEKNIIVITDGVNYQFNARNPRSVNDVLAAEGDRKVRVDIVGFGIPAGESEQARREFTMLTQQTGGTYTPATNATSLIQSLESLLGPSRYSVYDAAGIEVGRAPVGSPIVVPKPRRPQFYTVALDSLATEIELAGGEVADLVVSRDGSEIKSIKYDRNSPVFAQLMHDNAASGLTVGVHRPIWQDQGVRYQFSFQNADGHFTARPAESWIEVTPVVEGSKPNVTYLYYDVNYVPDLPVPLLQWPANHWPVEAKQAEIRLWCKPTSTRPDWTVNVGNSLQTSVGGATLPGLAGVSYQVRLRAGERAGDPLRVAVIERHAEASPGLGVIKVELSPQADRVVRRFDAEHRLATHTFYFDQADEAAALNYEIRFTTRSSIQAGSWHLDEPITVNVAAGDDVIRLVPAAK